MASASPRSRRSTVSVACNACRQRRSKCDGNRPTCSACEIRGSQCEYASIAPGESHAAVLKRKHGEAEAQLESYQKLFEIMRNCTPVDALGLMALVRSGADASSIVRSVEGGHLMAQSVLAPDGYLRYAFPYLASMPRSLLENRRNPYLGSRILRGTLGSVPLSNKGPSAQDIGSLHPAFLLPYHTAILISPDLSQIRASSWTSVVEDATLVRRLLEIYFLQEYPFLTFFHMDGFLHDMQHGGRQFCSSLLVNSILACAAHGQRDATNRADFWSPQTWSYKFEAEARRLWEFESMEPSLTTIQAGLILSVTCNINGNDTLGSRYLSRAVEMAIEMDLFSASDSPDASPRLQASRALTAWSLFAWQATTAFHLHITPLLHDPPNHCLPSDRDMPSLTGEISIQYPLATKPVNIHLGVTFKALIEFRSILNKIAMHSFSRQNRAVTMSLEEAVAYRTRLNTWASNLPQLLAAEDIIYPSHLKLHIHFHNVMLTLFKPFAALYQSSRPNEDIPDTDLQSHDHPLDIVIQAKSSMETIIRLYYLRHGFETWDSMMPQFISSVGFSAAEDLAASTNPDDRREILSTLILCIKGMYDQGKSMYVSEVIYRLLRATLAAGDERLLREFAEIDHEQDRAMLMEQHVHSAWPIRNAKIDRDAKDDTIGSLVRQAARVNVDDEVSQ